MTPEEFTVLTKDYVAATQNRLGFIREDLAGSALTAYREAADREWELGRTWDEEVHRAAERDTSTS